MLPICKSVCHKTGLELGAREAYSDNSGISCWQLRDQKSDPRGPTEVLDQVLYLRTAASARSPFVQDLHQRQTGLALLSQAPVSIRTFVFSIGRMNDSSSQ